MSLNRLSFDTYGRDRRRYRPTNFLLPDRERFGF